jgi:L-fuconolactonase
MRIDSHQHFWRYHSAEYPWIGEEMDILRHDYLPPGLYDLLVLNGIDGTVAVQARRIEAETSWLLGLSSRYHWIRGVVGWVDMEREGSPERIAEFAQDPRFRGIRYPIKPQAVSSGSAVTEGNSSAATLSTVAPLWENRTFDAGMRMLIELDLPYDLLCRPPDLPVAVRLVDAYPNQRFILDHIAKPEIASGTIEPWAAQIQTLAERENVSCKVSGMITEAARHRWSKEDFRPYIDRVVEAFGLGRLMFGSDWPVCLIAGEYADTVRVISHHFNHFSIDERDALWGKNAMRIYGLRRISEEFSATS